MMMTLPTGNNTVIPFFRRKSLAQYRKRSLQTGYTLIELLLTVLILSVSIVAIFQSLILSLGRIQYLTHHMHATTLLDNRLAEIENMLRTYKSLPFELNHAETVDTGNGKIVQFKQTMNLKPVDDYVDVFQLDLTLTWQEGDEQKQLSRSSYITDFDYYHQK